MFGFPVWLGLMLATSAAGAPAAPPAADGTAPGEAIAHYGRARLLEENGDDAGALAEFLRVLAIDPRAGSAARRASEAAARLGESGRSLELADRALAIDPADARARWLKGSAEFNLGRARDALASLEAANAADTLDAEIPRTLARVAESMNRIDIVARAYRKVTDLDEDDGEGWFQLAAADARLGAFTEADSAVSRAADLNSERPGLLFLRGWIAESLDRNAQAMDLYRHHLELHSDDLTTRRRLVRLYAGAGRFADALVEAHKVTAAQPKDAESIEVEAEMAYRANKPADGAALLAKLRSAVPSEPEGMARAAGVLMRSNRNDDALALVSEWSNRHPTDPRGPMLLSEIHLQAHHDARALGEAQRAVSMAPDSLAPRVLLARLYQRQKQWDDASRVWLEAWRRFPDESRLALDLAFCREQAGQLDSAVRVAREVIRRQPENPQALNFLGYLFADHNRNLEEARQLISKALDKDPENGAYLDSMGWVYYRLGRFADARGELEKAVALTQDPVVHEHLGDVYKGLKLLDLAREQYRRSLASDSLNDRVRGKLQEIR
jgi:tetratricopeptide (TPR) repeat protein